MSQHPDSPHQPSAAPPEPYRVEIQHTWLDALPMLSAAGALVLLGGATLVSNLVASAPSRFSTIFGATLLLVALIALTTSVPLARTRRTLAFAPGSMELRDARGNVAFAVNLTHLASIDIKSGRMPRVPFIAAFGRLPTDVAVEWTYTPGAPAPSKVQRLFKRKNTYRWVIGKHSEVIEPVAAGLAQFAPQAFGGVQDLGEIPTLRFI